MNATTKTMGLLFLGAMLGASISACEKQGPMERAGEEIDEAVDTAKNGEETLETKVDDAVDELKE